MTLAELDEHLEAGRLVRLEGHRRNTPWRTDWLMERFTWDSLAGRQVRYRLYRRPSATPEQVAVWLDRRRNPTVHARLLGPPIPKWVTGSLCRAHPDDPDAIIPTNEERTCPND